MEKCRHGYLICEHNRIGFCPQCKNLLLTLGGKA